MKKLYFALLMLFAVSGYMMAQTIENFESIKMNYMAGGAEDLGTLTVVPNPDPTGINTSVNVVEFFRDKDGVPWGGFYGTLDNPIDLTANKYVHLKVWKTRITPVKFKLEGAVTLEIASMNPQTKVNEWEELVFDFTALSGNYSKIVFSPDFEDPLALTEDITLYFDDLTINNDPAVGSEPVTVMEDYESIDLNLMLNGDPDLSSMTLVANPDPFGVNLSSGVIEFLRDMDGHPWGGFWSSLPVPIDVTENKYIHVKVFKDRISPLKFKIEGGAAGDLEVESMSPQTKIGEWEDIVFDFSEKTGTYPIIALMPDFEDPLTLTEDITLFFDDIILNNDPNPFTIPEQVINVDMSESGLTGQPVYISGAIGGIHGTWMEPGTNAENEMTDPDSDGIYSITMHLPDGLIAFKFFSGANWNTGDPAPGGDRNLQVVGSMNVNYKWGVAGQVVSVQNSLSNNVMMYPNPVDDVLQINTSSEIRMVSIYNTTGQLVLQNNLNTSGNISINAASLRSGVYLVNIEAKDGSILTQKLMKR